MENSQIRLSLHNTCVTFGRFDAMHLGHREVVAALAAQKAPGQTGVVACIGEPSLITPEMRQQLATEWGADLVVPLPADVDRLSPQDFIRKVLVEQLGAGSLVAGENCCVGTAHGGALLRSVALQYDLEAHICFTKTVNGMPVSSEAVSRALKSGDPAGAAALLGRPYAIPGVVIHGKALGRTVGMPTANLSVPAFLQLPAAGVYATHVWWRNQRYQGLTNIGTRPSVDTSSQITIETLILDFDHILYGQELVVEPVSFLRPVQKFPNLAQVQAQVQKDILKARGLLSCYPFAPQSKTENTSN